ncbi:MULTISPECIES: hypothetical protein [Pseudomonas]|jgi:hypothetical protein|uniref:Bacterial CdiA-CT RNAse A domain-containing protein n=1 Tax=Pseudomonas sp. Hg7Tf TaxID=3236988 RepID=A0AB39I9T3_9PSED|nr:MULTISPECIES: hypothetical protein [Pseudomonas]KJK08340.1 hypothetical protein UB47_08305 [Pseudomonas sp. 5]MDD1976285.1 hypothetical protein [Pseudomonas putida]MDH2562172.1 hypothetical protein [Pseudomonas sp. Hg5Tf]QYX49310.1 hypothetical protein K3F43_07330 [Pseudomonas sp. S11A 273]
MPIEFHGDDLKLTGVSWDHILTVHGLEGCDSAMANGWQRKSKWYGDEEQIKARVNSAFDLFRQQAKSIGTMTLAQDANKRSTYDVDTQVQCGTGRNGVDTQSVRLVMEIKHSGDTFIVTAFPW